MNDDRERSIYIVIGPTGKRYVGQTVQPLARRWGGHRCLSKIGSNFYLHSAIRKYGADAFQMVLHCKAKDKCEADIIEKALILELKTHDRRYGYNLTHGGEGVVATDEVKKKIGRAQSRFWQRQTPEYRTMRAKHARKNQVQSKESHAKGSEGKRRWYQSPAGQAYKLIQRARFTGNKLRLGTVPPNKKRGFTSEGQGKLFT